MSDHSPIEWTDATWNPTTGCTKVSPGCAHCYIERTASFRIHGRRFVAGRIPVELHANRLEQPLHWRRPRRVFVNSLSDLFHDDVPDTFIDCVFATMALTPRHTYQVLTKRADRMRSYITIDPTQRIADTIGFGVAGVGLPQDIRVNVANLLLRGYPPLTRRWPLPNVWLGVSVENQHFADERIPLLLQTPAAVRFISAEPLLGSIGIAHWLTPRRSRHDPGWAVAPETCLDWVIVGGESGPGARPFNLVWGRSLIAQCQAAGVPVFVKQLGECAYDSAKQTCDPAACCIHHYARLKLHAKGGDMGEWPADLRVREFPRTAP